MSGGHGSVTAEDLSRVHYFAGAPADELAWLAGRCKSQNLTPDEVLIEEGALAEDLFILLEGALNVLRREGAQEVGSFSVLPGEISGTLPFSRMTRTPVRIVAVNDSRVARFAAADFPLLREHAPAVERSLVHLMVDRTREVTRYDQQREKLVSLGTMAAGLAHELNNPASAARRTARDLSATLQAFDEHSSKIVRQFIFREPPPGGEDDPFAPVYRQMTLEAPTVGALEQSDLEEDLAAWLEEQGVSEPWEDAPVLIQGGFTREFLEVFSRCLLPEQVRNFLEWVPKDVEMRLLARDLVESTQRIAELISAMKSYSYLDQGGDKAEIDLHQGIEATLRVLHHKLKAKNIRVVREYGEDLPRICAYGGELNQVWTNLLDNAAAAVSEGGTITVATLWDRAADRVCIDVIDDGHGVPEAIQDRIFEPFFTTRGVGEGTGLGLDISHRIVTRHHRGSLQLLSSEPGRTHFRVRLPLGD